MNGDFLEAAEGIAALAGLTAARWQVLRGILDEIQRISSGRGGSDFILIPSVNNSRCG
jgi:hypothetical protein